MFWDKVAGVYDIFTNIINRKTHQTLCAVIADLIRPTDEVLECACGTGMLSGVIAGKCKSLIATDFSLPMLKRAEKKCESYSNVTFQQGNILQIDFAAERFDVVVGRMSFICWRNRIRHCRSLTVSAKKVAGSLFRLI